MRFFAAVLALAAVATASPVIEARSTIEECSANSGSQVCCNGSGLLALNCLVQVLGQSCSNSAYCCKTDQSIGGLVNVNAANCLKLL